MLNLVLIYISIDMYFSGFNLLYFCVVGSFRVQKQRAAKSEDALEHLNVQLLERETALAELHSISDGSRARHDKLSREKSQLQAENSALKM